MMDAPARNDLRQVTYRRAIDDFCLGVLASVLAIATRLGHALSFSRWDSAIAGTPEQTLSYQTSWSVLIALCLAAGPSVAAIDLLLMRLPYSLRNVFDDRLAKSIGVGLLATVVYGAIYAAICPRSFPTSLPLIYGFVLVLALIGRDIISSAKREALGDLLSQSRGYKFLFLTAFGITLSAALLEILVRIHAPIPLRINPDQIGRPDHRVTKIKIKNPDGSIVESTRISNNIGFRGPDAPASLTGRKSVIAVGSSTTEDRNLSDDQTWVWKLSMRLEQCEPGIWVNNAGYTAQTTIGNFNLVQNTLLTLKPTFLVMLVGFIDLVSFTTGDLFQNFDENLVLRKQPTIQPIASLLSEHSALFNIGGNLIHALQPQAVVGPIVDGVELKENYIRQLKQFPSDQEDQSATIMTIVDRYLPLYRSSLITLVETTIEIGSRPILVTHPHLFGTTTDPDSGVDLGNIEVTIYNLKTRSASLWAALQKVNDVTRTVAAAYGVPLIEMAETLPKASSLFLDSVHYSPAGTEIVSNIIAEKMCRLLAVK